VRRGLHEGRPQRRRKSGWLHPPDLDGRSLPAYRPNIPIWVGSNLCCSPSKQYGFDPSGFDFFHQPNTRFGHLFSRSFSPPHFFAPSHPLPARAVLLPRGKRAVLPAPPLPASSATAASPLFSPTPPNTEAAIRQSSSQISQIPSRIGPSPSTPITARQAEHCRPCTLLALPPRQSIGSG